MDPVSAPRLLFDTTLATPQLLEFAAGEVAIFSQRCPDLRAANEDSLALIPVTSQSGIIAIADGCGGMAKGDKASRLAIESLRDAVGAADGSSPTMRPAILDGIENANTAVLGLTGGAATTMAVLEIDGHMIRPYHVGDSTIMLVGSRGRIKMQTVSHSPVGYAIQAGILDEDEAISHADRHLVSNVIGTPESHTEVGARRLMSQRDTVVMGSDGLFDNLYVGEIADIVRKGPILEAAQRLAEIATQRMANVDESQPSKPDDLTFALFRSRYQG